MCHTIYMEFILACSLFVNVCFAFEKRDEIKTNVLKLFQKKNNGLLYKEDER